MDHEFVEYVPDNLADGVLYISIPFATAVHRCCCGCGSEVVTPITPTDWSLTFDGESISLSASIGNWSLACQSHYYINHNQVRWVEKWSPEMIAVGRAMDRRAKARYYGHEANPAPQASSSQPENRSVQRAVVYVRRLLGFRGKD